MSCLAGDAFNLKEALVLGTILSVLSYKAFVVLLKRSFGLARAVGCLSGGPWICSQPGAGLWRCVHVAEPDVRLHRLLSGHGDRVLPGIGPLATIAMLLPATHALQPVALIMLAGIYYGAQYGAPPRRFG